MSIQASKRTLHTPLCVEADLCRYEEERLMVRSSRWLLVCLASLVFRIGYGAEPTHFRFVQITDTHWGARDGAALTRRAVEAINQLPFKIEFVVHTGDMLADAIDNESVVKDGLDAMKSLTAPVFYVPGNHDILKDDLAGTAALYKKYFGPLSRRAEVQGVVCLFFYSEPLVNGFRVRGYDALGWLEENLKQAGEKPILLFQHSPSVGTLLDKHEAPEGAAGTREAWEALVKGKGSLKAIVAGHLHRDELHWVGQIPLYVSAPMARFWDRQPSFRVYEYWDGKLSYWTEYLEDGKSRRKSTIDKE